jgi:hypothetical protein
MDASDRVSVELELAHDDGRKVDPTGTQLAQRDRLIACLLQSFKHPPLLKERPVSRVDCPS